MTARRRPRLVRQRDSMQCGVASLAMICRAFGWKDCTLDDVGTHCHATNSGVSVKAISDAAKMLGLEVLAFQGDTDTLHAAPLPAILHWNQNHFVVLHKIDSSGRMHILDPANGSRRLARAEFERHWLCGDRGTGIVFDATPQFHKKREEGAPRPRPLKFLWSYVVRHRGPLMRISLWLLIGSLLELVLPFLTQGIVDLGIHRQDIGIIWLILLGELAIVCGRAGADFLRRRLLLKVSMTVNVQLVSDFFVKLLKLPMSFFDTKLMGDLLQRINDHARVQTFLTQEVLGTAFSVLSLLVLGSVLAYYDLAVFAVFLAGSAASVLWSLRFQSRRKVIDYELFAAHVANQNQTCQFVTSMQEIKLQGCGERRREEWRNTQDELFNVQRKSLNLLQAQAGGTVFINELKNIVMTVLSATAVINGDITLGAMLAIQYIVGQLNAPLDSIVNFVNYIQDVHVALERISEVHGSQEEGIGATVPAVGERLGGIRFSNVSFRYDPHAITDILHDIDLLIPEGKVTAIVGASGSGKTTLVKLMLGYYPVGKGELCVGPVNLSSLKPDEWRMQCGAVMQEGVIFSESIERNIAVGDGETDTERMREAARIACIDEYIDKLPLGYATKIGRDGMGLSQGQKQRILIARAVYKNPAFIFLDEATNALDAKNERSIVENLQGFFQGRTVVIVAHRLSTVRDADNIVVLEQGRVVEQGTHDELTASRGAYYNLVKNQLELGN